MYIDGLWLSGMTLTIERSALPIPDVMQEEPISMKLTDTQVKALAVLLGLGMKDGKLMFYNDEDLNKLITNPEDPTLYCEYKSLTDGAKAHRNEIEVFMPVRKNEELAEANWHMDSSVKDASRFLTLEDVKSSGISNDD